MHHFTQSLKKNGLLGLLLCLLFVFSNFAVADDLTSEQWKKIKALQQQRIAAIDSVIGSVIAVYDDNREGGGSGVIIDPSGIALTNHHVIMGAGIKGWGGLADGKLYPWTLIGTDPGGDVAIIQMSGRDEFPCTPLGDSEKVRVGDWALAMGNPFILTEDQAPTVTLGIVSGVKRYQPGAGANQLVYGNCIQVDSSINPGNSGGPLFNFSSRVIGINGRGSFQDRGRVNVGLGYAISSNQIKNFIPDLLATKLVEHGTLDASFSDRNGKVVCSTINQDAPVAQAGLKLGDELLEFEGETILNANQFTNLICTLPEDWPAKLIVRNADGIESTMVVRLFGLPYAMPQSDGSRPKPNGDNEKGEQGEGDEGDQEQERQAKRESEMKELLSAPPGEIRYAEINRGYTAQLITNWQSENEPQEGSGKDARVMKLTDELQQAGQKVGSQTIWIANDGRFLIEWKQDQQTEFFRFDGKSFYRGPVSNELQEISLVEAKLCLPIVQALAISAAQLQHPFKIFGTPLIHGGDKALDQNAYRLCWIDADDDKFFAWLSMYGDDGLPQQRLLKVSAEKDCDDGGGVTFADWQQSERLLVPRRRSFVKGLIETPVLEIENQQTEWLSEVDVEMFGASE